MFKDLDAVAIVCIVFFSLAWVIRLFLEHRTRMRLIERGLVDENARYLYAIQRDSHCGGTLKWGIILVAIGSAFLAGELFPYYVSREMTIAFMFLFSGIGLLLYYWFGPKKTGNGIHVPPNLPSA